MKKKVYLLRGIPGSGKSTYTKELFQRLRSDNEFSFDVCSADSFFLKTDENNNLVYQYDISKISQAHAACMSDFIDFLKRGVSHVVVDNTMINIWEVENYIKLAKCFGYEVVVIEFTPLKSSVFKCFSRQIHNVPLDVCMRMFCSFESLRCQSDDLGIKVVGIVI